MPSPRRPASMQWEMARAMLALAGVRMLKQSSVAVSATSDGTYTVTEPTTRRVITVHLSSGGGDIRFDYNAAASATDFPIIPQRYFTVDAKKDDVLHFYNTTAGAVTVYVMEIQ